MLTHSQAREFYDRFGARQDSQRFYEDRALAALRQHGDFESATSVLEFGCGTGRFAESLLEQRLPPRARYEAIDVSGTMVALARRRLARFGPRVVVRQSDGPPEFGIEDHSLDRVVSTYVIDLLSEPETEAFLAACVRALRPKGKLCVANITTGRTPVSRIVTAAWKLLFRVSPRLVGGCRPVQLRDRLPQSEWCIPHHEIVSAFGVASEVLIAEPRTAA